jgi:hypothetical protein
MAYPVVNNVGGSNPGPAFDTPDFSAAPVGNVQKVGVFSLTLSPVAVAAASAVEQSFAATGIGLLTTDFVQVQCAAPNGCAVTNARVSAADTLTLQFVNPTASSITPTASTIYTVNVLRPLPNWAAPASGNQLDW